MMAVFLAVTMSCSYAFSSDVLVSGFLRAGAAKTSGLKDETGEKAKYLERVNNDHADYGDTNYGVNITSNLTDEWTVAGQLWASGAEENFNLMLDWAFASYRPSSNFTANFGKIKFPNALVSEVIDVGLLYPWVRPPQEFYNMEAEGPNIVVEAFNGATLIWGGEAGDFSYSLQPFVGSITAEAGNKNDLIGLKLAAEGDYFSAQVSQYSAQLEFGTVTAWPEPYQTLEGKEIKVTTSGLSVDWNNIVVMGEYGVSEVDNNTDTKTEAYYATIGYRMGRFLPHVTSASLSRGEADEEAGQESTTLGLKYQVRSDIALKTEWQKVKPKMTAAGESILVGGAEQEDFSVFSVAIDVVF